MPRSNFEDWVGGDNDDDIYFDMPKYERGGRKNKKKKKGQETRVWDWDDVYDPTLPNNYVDYKGSEEQVREIRDWKARLYHHKLNDRGKGGAVRGSQAEDTRKPVNRTFPFHLFILVLTCAQECLHHRKASTLPRHLSMMDLARRRRSMMMTTTTRPPRICWKVRQAMDRQLLSHRARSQIRIRRHRQLPTTAMLRPKWQP